MRQSTRSSGKAVEAVRMAQTLAQALTAAGLDTRPGGAAVSAPAELRGERRERVEGYFEAEGWVVTERLVELSRHAVARYRERFGSEGDTRNAAGSLYRLLGRGVYMPRRPDWLAHRYTEEEASDNVGYLVIDDEIACPLRESTGSVARLRPPLTVITFLYRWKS